MAKKKKTKGKSSRRSSKRAGKKSSRRSSSKSSPIGKAFKDGLVIGAGALVGALLETTGYVPSGVSAPAIGVLAAGVAMTGGRRMPSAIVLASAVGLQTFHTVSATDKFAELEQKLANAMAPVVGAPALAAIAGGKPKH